MLLQHETRVTPWRPFEGPASTHVRIWQRLTPFGMFQRHEWRSVAGEEWAEGWIPSCGKRWAVGAETYAEPSDTDALIEALRRIAEGHNDPRALARETLANIGTAA